MAITGIDAIVLLVGRILFGGTIAFMGLNHMMNPDMMIPYAESKDVPRPKVAVYLSGIVLVLGGLSIVTGILPAVGAILLAVFFLVVTPTMHDFWSVPEERRQDEMTDFLKNVVMFGASLGFLSLSTVEWGLSVGIGLI